METIKTNRIVELHELSGGKGASQRGKLKQVKAKLIPSQAGEQSLGVCRDLTGDTLRNIEGEEKVHSLEKSGGKSA